LGDPFQLGAVEGNGLLSFAGGQFISAQLASDDRGGSGGHGVASKGDIALWQGGGGIVNIARRLLDSVALQRMGWWPTAL